MPVIQRIVLLLAAAVCFVLAAVLLVEVGIPDRATFTGWELSREGVVAPELRAVAPPVQGYTLDGGFIRLEDLRGTPVIVNFWATWCVPCLVEMPELQEIYEEYQEAGLRILAVNLSEPPVLVREWVTDLGLTFDIVLDDQQMNATFYRLRTQPSTFLISPDGTILHIFHGIAPADQLRWLIDERLEMDI